MNVLSIYKEDSRRFKKMINLDERYHDCLMGHKKIRLDGISEKLIAYGWHCDGNEIKGYYLTTENYKLYYNMKEQFVKMEAIRPVAVAT